MWLDLLMALSLLAMFGVGTVFGYRAAAINRAAPRPEDPPLAQPDSFWFWRTDDDDRPCRCCAENPDTPPWFTR